MKKIISTTPASIDIIAPASKSQAVRSIALAMLSLHFCPSLPDFKIHNFTTCQDTESALRIANALSFTTTCLTPKTLTIKKNTLSQTQSNAIVLLDCGESALCWHIFNKLAPIFTPNFKMLQAKSLQTRIASQKNVSPQNVIQLENNTTEYKLDCHNTSQNLTALLLVQPFLQNDTIITAQKLVSKGYADLTADMLAKIGINTKINHSADCTTIAINGNQKPTTNEFFLEGDWSAGAFFFVLGACAGGVNVANLTTQSLQPDKAIIDLFDALKVNYEEYSNNIFCIEKSNYNGFNFDATNCPDLIPALVVLAFNATSNSTIYGIERLINKESNRRDALLKTFSMLGGKINISNNYFHIQPSNLSGGFADSNADHRIAMTLGIAAKLCRQPLTITRTECVAKSFPEFWNYIK